MTETDAAPVAADVAGQVWRGMRTLVLERHDRRRAVAEALGMGYIRVKALRHLTTGPLTMRQLAGELAIDPPYTTVVVDDLERRGLAARSAHPRDRRSKLVTITPEGVRVARRAERLLNEAPAPVRALSGAELATLDRLVTKLLAET